MFAATTYRTATEINTAMASVYKHMAFAVLNSMLVAWFVSNTPALSQLLFNTALVWVVIFAPLVAVFFLAFKMHTVSTPAATLMLHGFAALMGLSLAAVFITYTLGSIVSAFMGAAVLFAVMSFYGYFTRQSLDTLGKYLFVGLIAIIIASIINLFVGSSVAQMVISALAIIIFLGLTAYDTQKIREELMAGGEGNAEIRGALTLYLDFINLFVHLLSLFGVKKD